LRAKRRRPGWRLDLADRLLARGTLIYHRALGGCAATAASVSVRLDDDVRETLEAEARARHIGLSTYLRQIAIETAARLPRVRMMRAQSRAVGEYVASSAEAAVFYDEWGTPRIEDT
jgi:hypothetical protein